MQTCQEQALERLREEIESVVGRKMKTPKDFDFLAGQIFDKLHENVSSTTLKRIWGYLPETSAPRASTLDLLAQYVDYEDWESFCHQGEQPLEPQPSVEQKPLNASRGFIIMWTSISLAVVAIVVLLLAILYSSKSEEQNPPQSKYVISIGDYFNTSEDYLRLFGITGLSVLLGTSRCRITLISSFGGQHTIIRSGITMVTVLRCCPPLKNTI